MTTVPLRPAMLEVDLGAAADNIRAGSPASSTSWKRVVWSCP